ncbi:hypothetical protein GUITHDRAFT_118431 [Guillardia theta CCMP2712]|uniref:Uncharacterized protein n=1 Tax=Guillardia theta (strain CCMP2712) TaxID=905079 RepID=L1IGR1_GUITC|nr:hypothetical protein GUITHDRAFT_118431 [Guillardia theta CCMP2712]EKX35413.1 hypothetical protein GUITHDRAFT_118431 [Guillardia theta CCMP2712]|eukprot:XP_005822393.1 hypothetical protein GUITHDRAFT_118431 [Guillardia theta CCMP2712]
MAFLFTSDFFKGILARELELEFGIPFWMVPVIGLVQASIGFLNLYDNGKHLMYSQMILGFLMGGCFFSHTHLAKNAKNSSSAVIFLAFGIAIHYLQGYLDLHSAILLQCGCGMLGHGGDRYLLQMIVPPAVKAREEQVQEKKQQ